MTEITTRMKRHVRFKLKDEKPTIWVGKDGLTPQVSSEVENQLARNKMVKIRILPSALQGNETAQSIAAEAAKQTLAALVEVRGHVFILYRRHKKPTENKQYTKTTQPNLKNNQTTTRKTPN